MSMLSRQLSTISDQRPAGRRPQGLVMARGARQVGAYASVKDFMVGPNDFAGRENYAELGETGSLELKFVQRISRSRADLNGAPSLPILRRCAVAVFCRRRP